jgi:hypothetical protein
MKKLLLFAGLFMGFLALSSTPAHANCWRCISARTGACQKYAAGTGSGGCRCIEGNANGYHLCAVCGFCDFGYCLYGCDQAAMTVAPTSTIVAKQAWVRNITIPARLSSESKSMSELTSFVQSHLGCTSWRGSGVSNDGPEGFDWELIATTAGSIIEIHHDSGTIERAAFTKAGWTFTRNGKLIIAEK